MYDHRNPTTPDVSALLADDTATGIPTTTTGPDGMPVNGVSPVCPSAKLSNPTVSRFTPTVDDATPTLLPDDSAGNEVGRQLTLTGCDTEINAGVGGAAVTALTPAATSTLVVELTTMAVSATVE